jgi:tRNA threonylcarbamoyladenosine biosynthesis protein TsaE
LTRINAVLKNPSPAYNPFEMPILPPNSLEFISRSPEQTRRAGMRLGALLQPGDVIGLVGELGSGKTTLVQGIASGWGSLDSVSSPTFVLVNVYRRPNNQVLYHLDAYRLSSVQEAEALDLDNLTTHAPLIVEWADRIKGALPAQNLWVTLKHVFAGQGPDEQRDMLLSAHGVRYFHLLADFQHHVFGTRTTG